MVKRKVSKRGERDAKDAARWRWWRKWWADWDDELEKINAVQSKCRTAAELDAAVDEQINRVGGRADG